MGKVSTKHILRLLWKMVENMFFLDSEHIGMGGMLPTPPPPPPPKKKKNTISIEWGGGTSLSGGLLSNNIPI